MKYVCAMCGKEEEVTGCLSTPTFQPYTLSGRSRPEDVRRNEGLNPNDRLCPNCHKRLERKYNGF
jgi:hypothetical protein